MKYIAVRTYGNGQHMNKIYPTVFTYLSTVENKCSALNKGRDGCGNEDKWIPFPLCEEKEALW